MMHWEKMEIIEWLVENASNKEIEGLWLFLCEGKFIDGLYKFMTKKEFKLFHEDMKYIDNKYLEEDE